MTRSRMTFSMKVDNGERVSLPHPLLAHSRTFVRFEQPLVYEMKVYEERAKFPF